MKDLFLVYANPLGNYMVTDGIADLLVRLQNASRVGKTRVSLPASRMKRAVAEVLEKEGYVAEIDTSKKNHTLSLTVAYHNNRPAISGFKRISKPSRRLYLGVRDIRPVKRGHGLVVLSTPGGVMTGKEAQQKRLGGEVLFEIW